MSDQTVAAIDTAPVPEVSSTFLQIAVLAALAATGTLATNILLPSLPQMAASLQASEVSVATMQPEMVHDWVAKDGTARIQVFPKDISGSNQSLNAFSKAVMKGAPDATGAFTAERLRTSCVTLRPLSTSS